MENDNAHHTPITGIENGNAHHTPTSSSVQEQRRAQAIKILKDSMLQLSISQNPSLSKSQLQQLSKKIDLHLPSLLPSNLRTPNHPPYAEMISTAIRELKKKKGSTKASISAFIISRYQDLPIAHEELLSHHLEKLVSVGEIVAVNKLLYTLPSGNADILDVPPLNASMSSPNEWCQNKEVDTRAIVVALENGGNIEMQLKRRGRPPRREEENSCLAIEVVKPPLKTFSRRGKQVTTSDIVAAPNVNVLAIEYRDNVEEMQSKRRGRPPKKQELLESVKEPMLKTSRLTKQVTTSDIVVTPNVNVLAIENRDNVEEKQSKRRGRPPKKQELVEPAKEPVPVVEAAKEPFLKTFSRRQKTTDTRQKQPEEMEVTEPDVVTEEIKKPMGKTFSRTGRGKPAEKLTL